MKPYKLSLVQALNDDDKVMRRTFRESIMEKMEDDETLFSSLVYSDEANSLSVTNLTVTVCAFGERITPMKQLSIRDSPTMNVFVLWLKIKSMVTFSLKKTLSQDQPISQCFKTGYLLYRKQILMTSFFSIKWSNALMASPGSSLFE